MQTSNRDAYSVVTPLAIGTALGGAGYVSRSLDDILTQHGITSGMKFNPHAVKAIKDYARAKASDMRDPEKFIYRYANLANRASKSQLFLNDNRRTWEWFTNNPVAQSLVADPAKRLQDKVVSFRTTKLPLVQSRLEHLFGKERAATIIDKLTRFSHDIELPLHVLKTDFEPIETRIKGLPTAKANSEIRKATHIAELAQSRERALKRLMFEGATKEYIVGKGNQRKYLSRVTKSLGPTGKWIVDPKTGLLRTGPIPGSLKTMNFREMRDIIDGDPMLSRVASGISRSYNGKNFGKLLNIFRFAHAIRNPKLRMLLSAGSLGGLSLGMFNFGRNTQKSMNFNDTPQQ